MPHHGEKVWTHTQAADASTPGDFDTIAELVAYLIDKGGGKGYVKYGVYDEDSIEIPRTDIFLESGGAIVRSTANGRTIFDLDGTDEWPPTYEGIGTRIEGFAFSPNDHDNCIAIRVLNSIRSDLHRIRTIGDVGHPFLTGILYDSTVGKWCEMATIRDYHWRLCTTGILAMATSGANSMDHLRFDQITGNLVTDGDIGLDIQNTVAHVNNGYIRGHMWFAETCQTGTAWRLAAAVHDRCRFYLGFEAFDDEPVARVGIDLAAGSFMRAEIVWNDSGNPDTYYTDKINGLVRAYYVRELGYGELESHATALCDPAVQHGTLMSSTTMEPPEDHGVRGLIIRGQAGENMWTDVRLNVVYLANDGKFYKTDANAIATMPAIGLIPDSMNADEWGRVLLYGVARDDNFAFNQGDELWVGQVAGSLENVAPVAVGDIEQKAGIALTDDCVFFNPDRDYIAH